MVFRKEYFYWQPIDRCSSLFKEFAINLLQAMQMSLKGLSEGNLLKFDNYGY
jgi:hypothetical protein